MRIQFTHNTMNPVAMQSEHIVEEMEEDFIEWYRQEIEPYLDANYFRKGEFREELLQNLKYSLRVAYNRGFTDAV